MFILRIIKKGGSELNVSLGDSYNLITLAGSPDEFNQIAATQETENFIV